MIPQARYNAPALRPVVRVTQTDMDKFLLANFHKPRLEPGIHNLPDVAHTLKIERMFAEGEWVKVGDVRYEV